MPFRTRRMINFLLILMPILLTTAVVAQDRFNQVQLRVYETVDRFLNSPVVAIELLGDYYNLGAFPFDLGAPDRDAFAQKYLYSLVSALNHTGLKPYYGLEDGTFLGYLHANPNQVPRLVYREPGNSGFLTNHTELGKYVDTCVDERTGATKKCLLSNEEDGSYISCVNDCEQIPCRAAAAFENGEVESFWCSHYEILQFADPNEAAAELGYIPRSTHCIDQFGAFSQVPGAILKESADGIISPDGTCTFPDGSVVKRNVSGSFANCLHQQQEQQVCASNNTNNATTNSDIDGICNNTFAGAYYSTNYDPRWRGWYIASRTTQVPRFSDPYIFFTTGIIGITYSYPIHRMDEKGRNVFAGVLAVDMELDDVSQFLRQSFEKTIYTAVIYEDREPHRMIGVSTGSDVISWVLEDDPTIPCTEDQIGRTPRICITEQLTINTFEASIPDTILRKAHEALIDKGYDSDAGVAVREDDDDVAAPSYLATSIVYELPGANLKWRIVVTSSIETDPEDSITRGEGTFVFICLVGGLGFTLCFLLFCAFYRRRNEQAVQFADFQFTSAFLLCAACLNLSTFTLLGEASDDTCLVRMWVFFMLSSMVISPLFIKAYRTYKLLGSSIASAMNVKMDNFQAWIRTLPIPMVQLLILFIFTNADPWTAREEINLDAALPTKNIVCRSETNAFVIIQGIYDFVLLFMGCVLAYLTRKIDPRFGDAKALLFAMYNIAFTTLMIAIVMGTINTQKSGKHVLQAIGVFWGTVFSAAAFVLPRLVAAKKERKRKKKHIRKMRTTLENRRRENRMTSHVSSVAYLHDDEDALKILVCTGNLGNAEPTLDSMKAWIPEHGACSCVTSLNGDEIDDADQFDMIVIGMQEAKWVRSSKRADTSIGESAVAEGSAKSSTRSRRGSIFSTWNRRASLSPTVLALEEDRFKEDAYMAAVKGADIAALRRLIRQILGDDYTIIAEEQRGQMRQSIWALKDVVPGIRNIKVTGVNTGVGNVLANKGGIVTSMVFHDTRLTFLSAHLAAHEGDKFYQARCSNMSDILKNAKTCELNYKHNIDLAISTHHMFVLGDLNYRIAFDDDENATHEEKYEKAMTLIEAKDWKTLYSFDELQKGVENGHLLVDFKTLPCHFSPTFKVNRTEGFDYMDQRIPSYTDRILFKSSPGLLSNLKSLSYEPCVDFITSDHKPVRGAFSVVPNDMVPSTNIEGRYRLEFKEMECSDLLMGDSDSCNPYVMFVWDSVGMKEEVKVEFNFWRRNKGFPCTSTKYKNQNPKWKKSYSLVTTSQEIKIDGSLYLCVYDYEMVGDDDILGTLALNLHSLLKFRPGETSKEVSFDKPLERYGKPGGSIKCKIEISMLVG
jgi:hypothetical protein